MHLLLFFTGRTDIECALKVYYRVHSFSKRVELVISVHEFKPAAHDASFLAGSLSGSRAGCHAGCEAGK